MISGAQLSKIKKKILPPDDGQDTIRLRSAVITAVNSDGTADITLSGVTVAGVSALGSAVLWPGATVQVMTYRGSLLIIGPAGSGKMALKKSADQNLTLNSTTMQNVTELSFSAAAQGVYMLTLFATYTGNSTTDIAFAWSIPSGADMLRHCLAAALNTGDYQISSMAVPRRSPGSAQGAGVGTTTNGFMVYREDVMLLMGSTPGTVQLQAAQNSTGSTTPQAQIRGSSLLLIERYA
jgi:hypothetical protein